MTSDPHDTMRTRDHDTEPLPAVRTSERQRAAIALGVLAIVALVIVGIMVAVFGSSSTNGGGTTGKGNPTGPPVTVTGGAGPSNHPTNRQSKPPGQGKHRHSSLPPSRPHNAPVSCPTSSPCDLPDDVGNVVQALNAFRAQHGMPPVRGTVTKGARTCAVSSGNDCPSSFFWEPVGRSGRQVIAKIADSGDGYSWLLNRGMTAVQVGWAYIPSSHSFECALVSNAP